MKTRQQIDPWLEPFLECVRGHGSTGPFLLCLPEYRPDLARTVADVLGCEFFDYRAEVMAPLGWQAHELSLDDLDDVLKQRADIGSVAAFNIEALLATKSAVERRGWLERFVETSYSAMVVIPLSIYVDDAPVGLGRVTFVDSRLPEQSFLNRLAL
ncbi:MAG: hypothetical protein U9R74_00190 [Pseudomonadota bacterium]|nr:hypothetical protein [Pseudomonadota bacterium]